MHFRPALRDQVLARYNKLDIPTYWCGINSELAMGALATPGNQTPIVTVSYPRDFVKQQLNYAAMYAVQ